MQVQAAVDQLVLAPGDGSSSSSSSIDSSIDSIVIAGHSMGAGVGTLLAHTLHTYLRSRGSAALSTRCCWRRPTSATRRLPQRTEPSSTCAGGLIALV
jgi:hypothetical protein